MPDITDDFNRANGGLGANWETMNGSFSIVSNKAQPATAYSTNIVRRAEAAFPADQFSEVDVTYTSGIEESNGGPAVRVGDDDQCYMVRLFATGVDLRRWTGSTGVYITDAVASYTEGVAYKIRLTVTGTTLTVSVNGTQVISTTDATLSTGKPGMLSGSNGASGYNTFDNFVCTEAYQSAGPTSDISTGSWGSAPLYANVDETIASDSDAIQSSTAPANDTCELKFGTLSAPGSGSRFLQYRHAKLTSGSNNIDMTYDLVQGTTVLQTFTNNNISSTYTTVSQTITASITDYSDVRVRIKANQTPGTPSTPTFVAAGTGVATATSGASINPGLPSGWTANDIHILVAHHSSNTDFNDPSGWTRITALSGNNTAAQRVVTWWRRAVTGDGTPTVSTSSASTAVRCARIYGVRGALASGDPFDEKSFSANAASNVISTATISTLTSHCLILFIAAYEDDPTAATDPSGYSTDLRYGTTVGSDAALFEWHKSTTSTTTENPSSTVSGGTFTNSPNVGILLAVKPKLLSDDSALVSWVRLAVPQPGGGGGGPTVAQLSGMFFPVAAF